MFIEVYDDKGRKYFDSKVIEAVAIEKYFDMLEGSKDDPQYLHRVWVMDTSYFFEFKDVGKAQGCYEYLKGFVKD